MARKMLATFATALNPYYYYGYYSRNLTSMYLLILFISAVALQFNVVAPTPQEVDPRLPYDSLNIIKLDIHAEVYQRTSEPPEKIYFDYVQLGQPPRTTRAIFATSTSEVWIPKWTWNPFARNLVYLMGHRCSQSVTCTGPASRDYEIDYQGTRLSGEAYSDQLVLGSDSINYHYNTSELFPIETKTGKITLKQRFLAIFSASNDGQKKDEFYPYLVIGLAPATDAFVSGSTTVLANMQKPRQIVNKTTTATPTTVFGSGNNGFIEKRAYGTLIDKELFSLWMQPLGTKGEIIFGGTDNRRYTGSINYHTLNGPTSMWQLSGSQLWLGRRLLSKPQGYTITIDSAVNDLYGPREIVEELYKELNATQHEDGKIYMVNCHSAPNLPEISFQFSEDASLNLPPKYYIRTMNLATNSFSYLRETCYVSIRPHNEPNNDWILGTHFLEAYYTVFDYTNRRIGFASSTA